MRTWLRHFRNERRGSFYIETALALPVLIFMVMGSIELGRYLLLNQKLQNASMSIADLAARDETLTAAQLDDMFNAVNLVVAPFNFSADGRAIVTGISAVVDDAPLLYWQRSGAGALSASSEIGTIVGNPAAIDPGLPVRADETIIAAEIFYDFVPFFGLIMGPTRIRHVAYVRPRLGTLQALAP